MISGKALLCLSLAIGLPPTSAWASPDLDALLTRLSRPAPQRTAFVEVRYSRLLNAPLRVAGELEYRGATSLAKTVSTPYHEQTQIEGETVSVTREGERARRFSLQRAPELRGLLASFGALLAGDGKTLQQFFDVSASGDEARWRLRLVPRDTRARRRIVEVGVEGADDAPRCFIVRGGKGEESFLVIGEAASALTEATPTRDQLMGWCQGRSTP